MFFRSLLPDCILGTPSSFTLSVFTPLSPWFDPVGCYDAYWLLPRRTFQNLRYRLLAFFLSYSGSWPVKMGQIRCPETSVNNYHTTPRNIPEERRSLLEWLYLWNLLVKAYCQWLPNFKLFFSNFKRVCKRSPYKRRPGLFSSRSSPSNIHPSVHAVETWHFEIRKQTTIDALSGKIRYTGGRGAGDRPQGLWSV
jgi:hypothetical protein